jgi:hypothetical protein
VEDRKPIKKRRENPMNKLERADWFNKALDIAGVPQWGRSASLVQSLGCSPATAQGWCRGSLPSDPVVLIQVCDTFQIDLYKWVNGEDRPTAYSHKAIITAVETLKTFEIDSEITLSPKQFAKMFAAILSASDTGNALEVIGQALSQK